MTSVSARIDRAAASHRRAAALLAVAGTTLASPAHGPSRPVRVQPAAATLSHLPPPRAAAVERAVRELAERLRAAAALLAPGWQGLPLDAVPPTTPLGRSTQAAPVRLGTAYPLDDASFPVVVPLGHLACDGDARDPRIAGLFRAVLLRLLATMRPGSLLVRPVDPTGTVFTPFAPLHDAGIMSPPVTDRAGLQAILAEAERWVGMGNARPDRTLLLAVTAWPQATDPEDYARLSALAGAAVPARLHLLVGGWPPPPLTDAGARSPLARATQVRMHNPYVVVGHPPGGSFASQPPPGQPPPAGLSEPVYLDPAPPSELVTRVCDEVARRAVDRARLTLGDLLPSGALWGEDGSAGLEVMIGRAGDTPARLRLADQTPHWLAVGRAGSGKTALLLSILYGLCTRYSPEHLYLYLLDFTGAGSFTDFVPRPWDPSYLPHARAVGIDPHLDDGLAVLRGLARQLRRRETSGLASPLPRVVCLIDGVDTLLHRGDQRSAEAQALLAALAERGGGLGIHLVLTSRHLPPAALTTACRVRIALPGGGAALDPANHAATALPPGSAVVNTASGLGGPTGATRAHEQTVQFPDPRADQPALAGLRHRLWRLANRTGGARP